MPSMEKLSLGEVSERLLVKEFFREFSEFLLGVVGDEDEDDGDEEVAVVVVVIFRFVGMLSGDAESMRAAAAMPVVRG